MRASSSERSAGSRSDRSHVVAMRQRSVAEVEEHRGHRPELDHRGEGGAGVLPAEQLGDDAQVPAARDRQELGEALHDAEHRRPDQLHSASSPPSARAGEARRDRGSAVGRAHEGGHDRALAERGGDGDRLGPVAARRQRVRRGRSTHRSAARGDRRGR